MKNTKIQDSAALGLKLALFTACLLMLTATPATAPACASRTNPQTQGIEQPGSHTSGELASYWWWIRRFVV